MIHSSMRFGGGLDAAVALLGEVPQRNPASEDAKLLADVINLEDFGVNGILSQAIVLAAKGQGTDQMIDAADKRDAYGYFEARLKDGFHFGPLREMARRRVARARLRFQLRSKRFGLSVAPAPKK